MNKKVKMFPIIMCSAYIIKSMKPYNNPQLMAADIVSDPRYSAYQAFDDPHGLKLTNDEGTFLCRGFAPKPIASSPPQMHQSEGPSVMAPGSKQAGVCAPKVSRLGRLSSYYRYGKRPKLRLVSDIKYLRTQPQA